MLRSLAGFNIKTYCTLNNATIMKYLNVAEKNDAAKNIAGLLSRGGSRRREGLSPYNKIYEFEYNVKGKSTNMVMTSVSGHLLTYEFLSTFRGWHSCNPEQLFDAPVRKSCPENYIKIKKTLEREVRSCNGLIIWTDCDREGENIGFEIINVCREIKPSIKVFRAKFSEITTASIKRAIDNLAEPDQKQSEAVDIRSELDLRIGAAFTRFQTLRLQNVFPAQISNSLVSYGSCQIPTLGFVAQRYKEIENFIPQEFWKIKLSHTIQNLTVEFNWARNRLFDKQCCEAYLMLCQANPLATVLNVTEKPKNKWRPTPLDTVELEKLGSRKLKINAKQTMTIAEKLYTQGIISYPRTETNMFSKDMNLNPLIEMQLPHPDWGDFAGRVVEWGPNPRNGKKSDQAHPPIHPTKFTTSLSGDEKKVYELIVRHFLACVSRDATGSETIVMVNVGDEEFTASGLCIHERNYLDVYPYDKWTGKEIHKYQIGNTFEPTELCLHEGSTTAPNMLTEADLIALMEKHGIGTDATHAEHINTIKERGYIGEVERGFLVPGSLGMGLVEGYDAMDLPLAQPLLRAGLEADLKLICLGQKVASEVLAEQVQKYKEAYQVITQKARALDQAMGTRFNETPREATVHQFQESAQIQEVFKCPKCQQMMSLKTKKDNAGYFLGCLGFPDCKNCVWFNETIKEITVADETCPKCGPGYKKLKIKFKQMRFYGLLQSSNCDFYTTCLACDSKFRDLMNINESNVRALNGVNNSINSLNMSRMNSSNNQISRPSNTSRAAPANPPAAQRNQNTNARPTNNGSWGSQPSSGFGSGSNNNQRGGWGSQNNNNNDDDDDDRRGGGRVGTWGSSTTTTTTAPASSWNNNSTPNTSSWINRNNSSNTSNTNTNNNNSKDEELKCPTCGTQAFKWTVKKDGPNQGREFYNCKTETCKYFQWADEITSPPTQKGSGRGSHGGGVSSAVSSTTSSWGRNNSSSNATGNASKSAKGTAKRKCGLCRQEGHTKQKCPQRQDM